MSEILEKTLAALPGLISPMSPGNRGPIGATGPKTNSPRVPRGFQNFVKSVMDAKSHSEEEKVVRKDLKNQQNLLLQPDINRVQLYDSMLRLIYCNLIGFDVTFAYIQALKLAQRGTTADKLLGYFAVSVFLHDKHDLLVLLVNTLQKDLKSTNIIDNCCGLTAICELLNEEMITLILPSISNLLKHSNDMVRRKAVIALHYISRKVPSYRDQLRPLIQAALCDRQPSVMAASLPFFVDLALIGDVSQCMDLVPVLVNILQQTIRHKLPGEMEYRRVPAPWLQIQILKILALLGTNNPRSSELMFGVLEETLEKSDSTQTISQAILYECILTIASVQSTVPLLDKAATYLGRLLTSASLNIKFVGLQALTAMARANPLYALDHQMIVIECLDSTDPTLVTQTLDILFKIATRHNIEAITDRLVHCLGTSQSQYFSDRLIHRSLTLILTHSTGPNWFFRRSHELLLATGARLRSAPVRRVLGYIDAESSPSPRHPNQTPPDEVFRLAVFECYMDMLKSGQNWPPQMLYMIAWVVGEYCRLSPEPSRPDDAVLLLADKFHVESPDDDPDARWWILSAILKLVPRCSDDLPPTLGAILKERQFKDMRLVQLISEIKTLINDPEILVHISSASNVTNMSDSSKVDTSLSFLDSHVAQMLELGCEPYKPKHIRQRPRLTTTEENIEVCDKLFLGVNFDSYRSPTIEGAIGSGSTGSVSDSSSVSVSLMSGTSNNDFTESLQGLQLGGVKQVWGRQGRIPTTSTQPDTISTTTVTQRQSGSVAMSTDTTSSLKRAPSPHIREPSGQEDRRLNLASVLFRGLDTPLRHSAQNHSEENS